MRITLHAVAADDHPAFREAVLPTLRAARLHDRRFTDTGLSIADADDLVPHLLEQASQRLDKGEMEAMLAERLGRPPEPGVWWALRTFAPLVHVPTGGPWSFGRTPIYAAAPNPEAPGDAEASLQRLILRYLEGFGPASRQDFAQFALLRQSSVRPAFESLADDLVELEGPDGAGLFDLPGLPLPEEDAPAPPRLMAMWDSVLLAHADRGRVIPPEYRRHVVRRNGDVLPTLLVDGYVRGVWRPIDGRIEALAFDAIREQDWQVLADEAERLLALLSGRDPGVYRRYAHWWARLPEGEVRILAA